MPKSLSSILGIDPIELTDRGAFDPILDLDTRLFLDPHLLKHCDIPEFRKSYELLQSHFLKIGKLLRVSESNGDVFWRAADSMMDWPEVKGLCIGYSSKGTSGSGIGSELRTRLLMTAQAVINAGQDDPEIFELVGLFEENFGCDRISDMTANIIVNDIVTFTINTIAEIDINVCDKMVVDEATGLPINPFTEEPLLLLPQTLLRDLPVALDWSDVDHITIENQQLRDRINETIGDTWKKVIASTKKKDFKKLLLANPELLEDLISVYSEKGAHPYNFLEDRSGEYIWYPATKKITKEHPLDLDVSSSPDINEVEALVRKICEQFKVLIEENGLSALLYNSDKSLKSETAAQLLFYGVCESYCDANGIMIARESDSGRGPVDFKFGTKKENSVLVEIKKSTNTSGLKKGIEKQLPQYMRSEKSRRAIYLVIDVGYTEAAIKNLRKVSSKINGSAIKLFHVDGSIKPSASKL